MSSTPTNSASGSVWRSMPSKNGERLSYPMRRASSTPSVFWNRSIMFIGFQVTGKKWSGPTSSGMSS